MIKHLHISGTFNGHYYSERAIAVPLYIKDVVVMAISHGDTTLHITKQQAMDFFGLVEPMQPTAIPPAAPAAVTWDILYLDSEDAIMVRHTQLEAITRAEAIEAFRADRGTVPYIVSVREHATDMNDNDD